MGVDRIGKGGMGAPIPSTVSPSPLDRASPAGGASRPFELASSAVQGASGVESVASGALEQLRAGHLTLDGYLDAKVHEATAQLALPAVELDAVRAALRERLASDPTLVELVRCATGAEPSLPNDE